MSGIETLDRALLERTEADVIVVGGGPAGSVTAALLAKRGLHVLVVEKSLQTARRICGEYLSPKAVHDLARLGLLDRALKAGGLRILGMRIVSPGGIEVDHSFAPASHALSVPRPRFDQALLQYATECGARLLRGILVTRLKTDDGGADVHVVFNGRQGVLRADMVIGADGRFSVVARSLGLTVAERRAGRGVVHGWLKPEQSFGDRAEMHLFEDGSYLGVNPLSDGTVNLSWVSDDEVVGRIALRREGKLALQDRLHRRSELGRRFERASWVGDVRYLLPLAVDRRGSAGDRAILVGDAAGFVDPLTGEGMHLAIVSAQQAAECAVQALQRRTLKRAAFASYERARICTFLEKRLFHRSLQWLIRRPALLDSLARRLLLCDSSRCRWLEVISDLLPARRLLAPSFWWPLLAVRPRETERHKDGTQAGMGTMQRRARILRAKQP